MDQDTAALIFDLENFDIICRGCQIKLSFNYVLLCLNINLIILEILLNFSGFWIEKMCWLIKDSRYKNEKSIILYLGTICESQALYISTR
jgi:hypothetical protein